MEMFTTEKSWHVLDPNLESLSISEKVINLSTEEHAH